MYKFKGKNGAFVTTLPATDISDDDYKALSDEQKETLKVHMKTDNPLYEKVDEPKEDEKAKDEPDTKKAAGSVDAKQGAR